ncbi:hypothetical protein [Pseudomonas syringae]|uniref:hypothetical protein n=1 Tax=Pseudomonas syringae TaxID=317 RepID=UPI0006B96071|nr:hypothetical protein [Pseudomonas syringae]KWS07644.1 hypothetical protein AL063_23495 [Pseudomonas syringae pv. syringae]POD59385.1 hypothetical protein BKM13_14775 [Pseudomonas syringae pv. syringae]
MIEIPYTQKNLFNCIGYKDKLSDKSLFNSDKCRKKAADALVKISKKIHFKMLFDLLALQESKDTLLQTYNQS